MWKPEIVVYEHPVYGECRVLFRWRVVPDTAGAVYEWRPESVEFDLFTPADEQARMLADLKTDDAFRKKVREKMVLSGGVDPTAPKRH